MNEEIRLFIGGFLVFIVLTVGGILLEGVHIRETKVEMLSLVDSPVLQAQIIGECR